METPNSGKIVTLVCWRKPDAAPGKGSQATRQFRRQKWCRSGTDPCIILRLEGKKEHENWKNLHWWRSRWDKLPAIHKWLWRTYCKKLWEVCCRPKSQTPHSRKRTGYFSPKQPTWKLKMKIRRMKRKMKETVKSAKWRSRRRGRNKHCAWGMDDVMRTTILSQCHLQHWNECGETRENVTCEVFCSPLPSVAADCYQL